MVPLKSKGRKMKTEKPQKITNKQLDKIIELFCIVDDRTYPYGDVYGMDTALFSTEINITAREKARKAIRKILKIKEKK
jgi:seryl-tRNA(Sec) selenium transferase